MDKLTILNRALVATGNTPLTILSDGSPEWVASDIAFERAIDYLMAEHHFPFATTTLALTRLDDSPRAPWLHAMQYPVDCWHLRSVYETEFGQPVPYTIIGNQILTKTDEDLKAFYVVRPAMGSQWHPAAFEVVTLLVEAELWTGLAGEPKVGEAKRGIAQQMLMSAAAKADQQTPGRQWKTSRVGSARRTRKIS